jgi:hypothetical protein
MKMTMNENTQSQGQNPDKQSRWEARLGRIRSSEKMSFKFLVKLIR